MSAGVSLQYIVRRVLYAIPVVFGVIILAFLLLQLAPGDLATVLAGDSGGAPPGYVDELRSRYGLDQPVLVQLALYIKNVAMFDLGFSFRHNMPVLDLLMSRIGPTFLLMGAALVLSVALGVLAGVVAALNVRTWKDHLISVAATLVYAIPLFWVGLMLILIFSIKLDLLPTSGMEDVAAFYEGFDRVKDIAWHLILPASTLALFYTALYARLMRASMLEQYGMEYVTTARAKGLTERRIGVGHVLRNALLPVVTMVGVQAGALLGGSIVVESIFAWPGLGMLAFEALQSRDYNLLLGILFVSAVMVVVVNLIVDILYGVLDPRIEVAK